MELWTAFTIGLLGSLHCVGMCGPIALSLPHYGQNRGSMVINILYYNIGRIATYSMIGSLIGLAGKGLFLAGAQSYLAIGLGMLFLAVALFSINVESKLLRISWLRWVNEFVKQQLGKLLGSNHVASMFGIGLLNGLLPCGLVYMAVAGAVTTGGVVHAMLYMALFGLGTLPLMLATALAGQFITIRWRNHIKRWMPAFLLAFALLFILRGIHFHLPPDFNLWEQMQNIPMCH